MKKYITLMTVLGLVTTVYAIEPPKVINFKNNVTYDHEAHKGDCNSCHDTIEGGNKISGFGKEWAHKNCINCHTAMGNGPTACKECHKK